MPCIKPLCLEDLARAQVQAPWRCAALDKYQQRDAKYSCAQVASGPGRMAEAAYAENEELASSGFEGEEGEAAAHPQPAGATGGKPLDWS
jgi:hypothetical protein